jgi:hypothetical protein
MCVGLQYCSNYDGENREKENICRGSTFGDFVTILIEGSMQDNTITRLQSTRVQTPLSPSTRCNVLRESLSEDSQNILCASLKRKGSLVGNLGNLYISLGKNIYSKVKLGSGLFLLDPDYLAITNGRIQTQ